MRRWLRLRGRVRDLLRRSRVERDIDDEIRFHVETEMEDGLRRGMTPQQARTAAHDSLGGAPLLVREEIHDARGVSFLDAASEATCDRAYGCCSGPPEPPS